MNFKEIYFYNVDYVDQWLLYRFDKFRGKIVCSTFCSIKEISLILYFNNFHAVWRLSLVPSFAQLAPHKQTIQQILY